MEPLGVAASVYGVISSVSNAQSALRTALSLSRGNADAQKSLRRLDDSMTMLKVMYLEILDLNPGNLSELTGGEPATHILKQIGEIHLAELNFSPTYPNNKDLLKKYASHVAESAERLEKALQRLRDIEQL